MSGIYIHIPFCKQRCSYCDFHFSTSYDAYRQQMIAALCREIVLRKEELTAAPETIYFGGGTPSLLTEKEFHQLFEVLRSHFSLSAVSEITLEANPDDINPKNLALWRKSGINRLSIGIQSFKANDLLWMNRAHQVSDSLNCVHLARDFGFENISVDLIYGLPELTINEWKKHLDLVVSMGVEHISAYCLTIEKKTALYNFVKIGKLIPGGEDQQCEQYILMEERLKNSGYEHYEISNFGKPGYHGIHNENYWKGKHYLGVGPSAHSFNGITRRWNIANNSLYMKMKDDTWFETEVLGRKEQWNELLLTGLRTSYGVDQLKLFQLCTPNLSFHDKVKTFKAAGWLVEVDKRLILTQEGKLRTDFITAELFR